MGNEILTTELDSEKKANPIILGDNGMIAALFKNPKTAENIYETLLAQGHKQEDITLVMSEETHNAYFPNNNDTKTAEDLGNRALEGLGVGAAVGGSVGALAAAIAALGTTLVIPGLGVVIAGSLAASFAGAGAGAAAGGVIGMLVGSETPDAQAKVLEEGLKLGGVVIAIKAQSDEERNKFYKHWSDQQNKESLNQAA